MRRFLLFGYHKSADAALLSGRRAAFLPTCFGVFLSFLSAVRNVFAGGGLSVGEISGARRFFAISLRLFFAVLRRRSFRMRRCGQRGENLPVRKADFRKN